MAPFERDRDDVEHGLPFRLMQNGFVTKYLRLERLDEDVAELEGLGFAVRRFDCSAWADDQSMHDDLRTRLPLPEQTGRNFDALADALADAEVPESTGLVVVLDNFDDRLRRDDVLLHVLADSARWWLLFGRLQPVLIRVDDPRHDGPHDLAATTAMWNGREWLDSARGL